MSFLKSLFGNKEHPINSYADFWNWFQHYGDRFYQIVKKGVNIEGNFFNKLSPKLNELQSGFWYLVGMSDDDTAELILTADGVVKNIAFVEELVAAAPVMHNWKITALKQALDLNDFGIEMEGYVFDQKTMHFYFIEHPSMPDEIDITITHESFKEKKRTIMSHGTFLTLDNALGELRSVTAIDNVDIINSKDAAKELIPLNKLKDFLIWREKEFVEKYKGLRHDTKEDNYSGLEATLDNGLPLLAFVNRNLLDWDGKSSHPWIAVLELKYNGKYNNGMPDDSVYQLFNTIEDEIMAELKDSDGYLNMGRQTADSVREIYFACIDFRKPSKVLNGIKLKYQKQIDLDFDIYKDKYWQSFDRFR